MHEYGFTAHNIHVFPTNNIAYMAEIFRGNSLCFGNQQTNTLKFKLEFKAIRYRCLVSKYL